MNGTLKNEALVKSGLPWHGWVLGGIFLLYGFAAAYDHVMSLSQGENYYRACGMTEAQVMYFSNIPIWATIGWALSVWGGLFGSLAIFFRHGVAITFFSVSFVGNLIYILYTLILSAGHEAMGALWLMPIALIVITVAMILYCRSLVKLNVLG